jgi:hypothetical protein
MNAEQIEILGTLRTRIKTLMNLYKDEKREKNKLKQDNLDLLRKLGEKEKHILELEQKYDNLKIARTLAIDVEEIHDAKIKVNRIVREIDKCIALLNR